MLSSTLLITEPVIGIILSQFHHPACICKAAHNIMMDNFDTSCENLLINQGSWFVSSVVFLCLSNPDTVDTVAFHTRLSTVFKMFVCCR